MENTTFRYRSFTKYYWIPFIMINVPAIILVILLAYVKNINIQDILLFVLIEVFFIVVAIFVTKKIGEYNSKRCDAYCESEKKRIRENINKNRQ